MIESNRVRNGLMAALAGGVLAAGAAPAEAACYDCEGDSCVVQDSWWDGIGAEEPCTTHGGWCHWHVTPENPELTICWGS
jgi:hypothetical protein